jgi:RND family efflux transporter MFP subunit
VQGNYFDGQDQQGIKVGDSRTDINQNMESVELSLDKAKVSHSNSDIEGAVSQTLTALDNISYDLGIIRQQCDEGIYYTNVSATDKASLDAQGGYINTASSSVIAAQASLGSYKLALQKAQDNLALKTASARPEDVDIYQSQIKQAQANVNALQSQLNDNYLASPINGIITNVNIKTGQVVSPSETAINLLSTEPFQIKVNIYEQDIVNVKIGDDVKINLVAFPNQAFDGKVLSINPAETIVDNVVYYEVTIEFLNQPDGIRSGMTADIVIEANKKENVLRIPKNAVAQINGAETVQVLKGNKIEDRTITVGLEGNDYFEVISGLSEGEQIITGKK